MGTEHCDRFIVCSTEFQSTAYRGIVITLCWTVRRPNVCFRYHLLYSFFPTELDLNSSAIVNSYYLEPVAGAYLFLCSLHYMLLDIIIIILGKSVDQLEYVWLYIMENLVQTGTMYKSINFQTWSELGSVPYPHWRYEYVAVSEKIPRQFWHLSFWFRDSSQSENCPNEMSYEV